MLSEVNEAKTFLIEKFGSIDNIFPGKYAIPTETSKGPAFIRCVIGEDMSMSGFDLWLDEELTVSWYKTKTNI